MSFDLVLPACEEEEYGLSRRRSLFVESTTEFKLGTPGSCRGRPNSGLPGPRDQFWPLLRFLGHAALLYPIIYMHERLRHGVSIIKVVEICSSGHLKKLHSSKYQPDLEMCSGLDMPLATRHMATMAT